MAEAPRILLEHHLKRLKLPTFLREYEKLARQCAAEGLDHVQFLARLVELELIDRERRLVERRIKQAGFPVVKQLESFDFKAIPGLNKMLVLDLARGEYIDRRENVILLGPVGTATYCPLSGRSSQDPLPLPPAYGPARGSGSAPSVQRRHDVRRPPAGRHIGAITNLDVLSGRGGDDSEGSAADRTGRPARPPFGHRRCSTIAHPQGFGRATWEHRESCWNCWSRVRHSRRRCDGR